MIVRNTQDAVLYARVSSIKQVEQGNGLDSQIHRCRQYADSNGYHVLKEFRDEGITGSRADRKEIQAVVDFIQNHESPVTVIMDEVTRLGRDMVVYFTLKDRIEALGGKVIFISQSFDKSPSGKFVENIMVACGEFERLNNKDRVIGRMKARVEAGVWPYGLFQGYKPSTVPGVREPYEPVAGTIRQALEGYAYGTLANYEDIARFINAQVLLNFKGKPIHYNGEKAKDLLESAWYYAGFIQLPKRNVSRRLGQHKPVISGSVLELIELRMSGKVVPKYRKNMNQNFPLKGHVLCDACNRPMTASFCGREDKYGYYYCRTGGCELNSKHMPHSELHDQFLVLLRSATPTQELIDLARTMLKEVWDKQWEAFQQDRHEWGMEAEKLDSEIRSCVDELRKSDIPAIRQALTDRIQDFSKRREVLKKKVFDFKDAQNDFGEVLDRVIGVIELPHTFWVEGSLSEKQMIQRLVFPKPLIFDQKAKKFRKPEKALVYRLFEKLNPKKQGLVDPIGIEPTTSCMPCKRSPS